MTHCLHSLLTGEPQIWQTECIDGHHLPLAKLDPEAFVGSAMLYCFLQFELLPLVPPIPMPPPLPPNYPPLPEEEMELSSEEESEYESGDDEDKERWGGDKLTL